MVRHVREPFPLIDLAVVPSDGGIDLVEEGV
jgi:hypothetical protein